MKKILLILICAVTMMGANAQRFTKVASDIKPVKVQSMVRTMSSPLSLNKALKAEVSPVTPNKIRKAPGAEISSEEFAGKYIQSMSDGVSDAGISYTSTTAVSIESELKNDTVFVTFKNCLDGASTLNGFYDQEKGQICIYSGVYCQDHSNYGKFIFYAIKKIENETKSVDYYVLNVEKDADGHISLVNAEDQEAEGWIVYMSEGNYAGYWWTSSSDLALNQPNATLYASEKHVDGNRWTSWNNLKYPCYVENTEGKTLIRNLFGSVISITPDAEDANKFWLDNGQTVNYGWLGDNDYIAFKTYNCKIDDEGYIDPVMLGEADDFAPDSSYVLPVIDEIITLEDSTKHKCLTFGTRVEKEGESKIDWDYIYVAKFTSSEGEGYIKNFWAGIQVVMNKAEEENTAISSVVAQPAIKGATYNLSGQKVNNSFKGVVIRDGKKFIK